MIIDEIWFYVAIAVLLVIAVFLFFLQSRYQRDAFELSQDLAKAQADLSQINQKFEQLAIEKNQIEQWAIQYKTQAQASIERINEKEAQINRLHSKIEDVHAQFTAGVSIQSYYAWPNPIATLSSIYALLAPQSVFILATPNTDLPIEQLLIDAEKELIAHPDFAAYKRYNLQLAMNPQANFISMDALIKQVQQVGFHVIECHQRHFRGGLNFLVLSKD